MEEGGITPGTHTVIRFTVSTPNVGDADLALGDPNAHVAAGDGLYEFAQCHNHYHFRHYALYQLIDPNTGFVWKAAKRGFCMIDVEKFNDYPGPNSNDRNFLICGEIGIPGNQGISKGWADTYVWQLGGQYFLLDGGDGQPLFHPETTLFVSLSTRGLSQGQVSPVALLTRYIQEFVISCRNRIMRIT